MKLLNSPTRWGYICFIKRGPSTKGRFFGSNKRHKCWRERTNNSVEKKLILVNPKLICRVRSACRVAGTGQRCWWAWIGAINKAVKIVSDEKMIKLGTPSKIIGGGEFQWYLGGGIYGNQSWCWIPSGGENRTYNVVAGDDRCGGLRLSLVFMMTMWEMRFREDERGRNREQEDCVQQRG